MSSSTIFKSKERVSSGGFVPYIWMFAHMQKKTRTQTKEPIGTQKDVIVQMLNKSELKGGGEGSYEYRRCPTQNVIWPAGLPTGLEIWWCEAWQLPQLLQLQQVILLLPDSCPMDQMRKLHVLIPANEWPQTQDPACGLVLCS